MNKDCETNLQNETSAFRKNFNLKALNKWNHSHKLWLMAILKNKKISKAEKLIHLEEALASSSRFGKEFKCLFAYYWHWYCVHWERLSSVLLLMLILLFAFMIPSEKDYALSLNKVLEADSNNPPSELIRLLSWTTEYAFHLLAFITLWGLAKLGKSRLLRLASISVLVTLIFSTLAIRTSKVAFGRLRPATAIKMECTDTFEPFNLKHQYHSFPSGHTSSAFSTTGSFFALNPYLGVPFVAYACTVGYARVSLKQHYPSDTIAGATVGVLASLPFIAFCRRYKKH